MRPTWDEYGLALAETISTRAACSRRQVGAVILDTHHRIAGGGYNGTPSGEVNCSDGGCPRGLLTYDQCPELGSYSNCKGRHAEDNAIDDVSDKSRMVGATIYVTRECCDDCSALIADAGITRVVTL